jgi:hypothetical protein
MANLIPVEYLATTEELTKIANSYKEEAIIKLTQNGSNVTGRLAASIRVQPARITATSLVIPVTMLKYGEYVDDGAERGRGKQPPVQDIKRWIQQKRISVPKQFKSVEQFAWAIAYNIGKQGQRFKRARPFIEPALNSVREQYINSGQLANAVALDLDRNIQLNINNTPGLNGN